LVLAGNPETVAGQLTFGLCFRLDE